MDKRMYVFDIEGDGLLDTITKLHCLCWREVGTQNRGSITDYQEMREWFLQDNTILVGHNICRYDIPAAELILGIDITADKFDTLPLSWTIFHERKRHGLEQWGEDLGIAKPEISDWSGLTVAEYIHRCSEDVEINHLLWEKEYNYLRVLYNGDDVQIYRFIKYLEFKMDCVAEQEAIGIRLDVDKCYEMVGMLRKMETEKIEEIEAVMPKVEIKKTKEYKNAIKDNSGHVAQFGDLFFASMVEKNNGVQSISKIEKVIGHKDPNAHSVDQIKKWLYSLGWVPEHIQYKRNKETGVIKEIPQISAVEKDGSICPSVKALYEKEPKLELLEGLTIITHRLKIFEGFLESQKDGRLYPSAKGLTNTLRLKHAVVVNLPDPNKKYGKEVRGCLLADVGDELCGSDLSNIEDRTKRHYIFKYDAKYVEEMSDPNFDAHLDIALLGDLMTPEQVEEAKLYMKTKGAEGVDWSKVRKDGKQVNFASTYKAGAKRIAITGGMPLAKAEHLHKVYWQRNWAIKKIEEDAIRTTIGSKIWLFNPISGFWYSLRNEKDIFSTLNQGSAVYCFDLWVGYCRRAGIKISLQMHDEILFNINNDREGVKEKIDNAMVKVNERLKLNVELGCSVDYGQTYASCH